jgi:hypothetical protein
MQNESFTASPFGLFAIVAFAAFLGTLPTNAQIVRCEDAWE